MKNLRKKFIIILFEISQELYIKFWKRNKKAWTITKAELLKEDKDNFGYHLGEFLKRNNFDLIGKVERHDCYHVITGYSTKVEDEIALQYLCFGNGKRSIYLFGVITIGTLLLPDYFTYYMKSYRIGKATNKFYHFKFQKLLKTPIAKLRASLFINLTY